MIKPLSANDLPPDLFRDRRLVVLLVDDQPIIGEAVRRALANQADIEFHYCSVASEAIPTAEALRPTLVHLYQTNPVLHDIPILVLSSKEDAAVKSQAFATGAADYLVKLPESIELVARIRHHSQAYLNMIERDAAYRALSEQQKQLMEPALRGGRARGALSLIAPPRRLASFQSRSECSERA